ncbi:hypothetical protein A33Q_1989 [Indibacter alkaliphilus LW1]|uniref:Lipoprotein n=1 Tax=Indibacter alkaliphilus (strain CCUG 57479 / KCTC 22604 / LW1) TaxID=1189612 RepID=S2DY79_INDAL|nr:hypothetical protein [Indibacter alkaliphilus]EOZ97071.1 hypothetical protein A33Q_1989 [Indibacter alkaliphilus LW1]
MMKNHFRILSFAFVIITIFSCDTDDNPEPNPIQDDFPDLQLFLDRFAEEASFRGFDLNLSGLDAVYVDEINRNDAPYCGYGYIIHPQTGRRTVEISRAPNCNWAALSDIQRENLFFHEMGHAFLNLPHDNALKCDGRPLSLMTDEFNIFEIYRAGEEELRTYYLDELFDRVAASEQCIDFGQDFDQDPAFFKNELEDGFWNFSNDNGNYQVSRGVHEDSGVPYLGISSEGDGQNTGYIYKEILVPNIPEGASVTLRTKINAENLQGPGVAIALRIYETEIGNTGANLVETATLTTENDPIGGTLEDHVLELTLSNFTRRTIFMIPFAVMMPGTEGKAYFDDFEIVVEDAS